jgi:hypothetical protein
MFGSGKRFVWQASAGWVVVVDCMGAAPAAYVIGGGRFLSVFLLSGGDGEHVVLFA